MKASDFFQNLSGYCRRKTRVVYVGNVGVGGDNPIRVQSMTISDTMDTETTVDEVVSLVDVGCEIVRITAPSMNEAQNLRNIKSELTRRGVSVPLVADIHYTPNAALIAADFVEKVRINPGNYADKKRFEQHEYTDEEYEGELVRIEEKFKPLVLKCKALGRAMRIGTNHGSLSDRIMNRYGDTPEGMVESALEFVRICEKYDYRELILSMKSSNPQVAIQAYRLLAARMEELGMDYPFHLGVTEAGDGEEGRIKSAVGIGALLEDGIGDTIRVSLTEDAVAEVPVAFEISSKYNHLQKVASATPFTQLAANGAILNFPSPFEYTRRSTLDCDCVFYVLGGGNLPRVEMTLAESLSDLDGAIRDITSMTGLNGNGKLSVVGQDKPSEFKCEAVHLKVRSSDDICHLVELRTRLADTGVYVPFVVDCTAVADGLPQVARLADRILFSPNPQNSDRLAQICRIAQEFGRPIEWRLDLGTGRAAQSQNWQDEISVVLQQILKSCERVDFWNVLFSLSCDHTSPGLVRAYRYLAGRLGALGAVFPIVLFYQSTQRFEKFMLDSSAQLGSLLCDGIGDAVHLQGRVPYEDLLRLSYNILQATRLRISKTDFISCPSCGRTLFNLQTTTERIKAKTSHLKGVKIAIMGCIVNGPGEMADADFGYVGAGPGKVNLFVGKDCVQRNIPERFADEQLVELIKAHGRWVEP